MRSKNKAPKAAKKLASIDGIVSDGRVLGAPIQGLKHGAGKTDNLSLNDSVTRVDGFHPMRQSPGGLDRINETSPTDNDDDQPIILDTEKKLPKQRRRLAPKNPRSRHILKHTILALTAFVLVGAIFLGVKFFSAYRHVLQGGGNAPALAANIDINQLKGEGDGRINILLLGIGGPKHDGGDLTDTILLASIDPINHQTALLSIPRDLWVQIPDDGYQKINAAYYYGKQRTSSKIESNHIRAGLKLLDKTLSPILGIPIHYHALINFSAFKEAVDAVGGVTVNVPKQLYDPSVAWENNYNPVIAKKGVQKFNGSRALLYVKSRKADSDFARNERQRLMLVAIKDKVLNLGTFSNPIRISQLLNSFGRNVYTDFSLNDLTRLYQVISQNPSSSIRSLDLVTPPHQLLTIGNINGISIDQPTAGLFNYGPIQSFVRNNLRDSFLIKENATVAVYNATSKSGLATAQSKVLKSFGYRVTTVDNTPNTTDPVATVVVDLTHGSAKYTRHYLEARFHVIAQDNIPSGLGLNPPVGTAFVIILGKDVVNATSK